MKCYGYTVYTGDWGIPLGTVVIAETPEQAKELGRKAIVLHLLKEFKRTMEEEEIRQYAEGLAKHSNLSEIELTVGSVLVLGDQERGV